VSVPVIEINKIDLYEEVRNLVAQVPLGKVTTYGKVAEALGDVVASRFVGKVMSENDDIVRVPCRRVVQSDGTIGGFTGGGIPAKKKALRAEGIEFDGDRIIDFEKKLFKEFKTTYPLKKFRYIQMRDSKKLVKHDDFKHIDVIAGSDIAYHDNLAFGALVLFDRKSRSRLEVISTITKVSFPYIPTYLTFREAEVVSKLVKKADRDMILVHDGNGIMHPLGFGIASHLGTLLDMPTIGVAKKLLVGNIKGKGETRKVMVGRRHVGYAVTGKTWKAPVFVSPGHRISTASSIEMLRPFWTNRLPDPVRFAHMEAEALRRESR